MSNDWHTGLWERPPPSVTALCLVLGFLTLDSCSADRATTEGVPPVSPQFKHAPMPDRAAGEYIVTVEPGSGEPMLRELYADYGIREIIDLGGSRFLIKLTADPGLDVIQRKGSESGKVKAAQPNFIYRLQ